MSTPPYTVIFTLSGVGHISKLTGRVRVELRPDQAGVSKLQPKPPSKYRESTSRHHKLQGKRKGHLLFRFAFRRRSIRELNKVGPFRAECYYEAKAAYKRVTYHSPPPVRHRAG